MDLYELEGKTVKSVRKSEALSPEVVKIKFTDGYELRLDLTKINQDGMCLTRDDEDILRRKND